MNGELVSGGRENLRVLIDYKGSGFPGGQMQDDLLLFSLRPDASPNPLALAVVNFPPIRGKRSLYIHRQSQSQAVQVKVLPAQVHLPREDAA